MKRQGEKNCRNKNQKRKQIRVAVIKNLVGFFCPCPGKVKMRKIVNCQGEVKTQNSKLNKGAKNI